MSCAACGGPLAPWLLVPGGEPADERRYALLRCGACGSAVTRDRPQAGAELYERGAYAPGAPRLAGLLSAWRRLAARQPLAYLRRAGLRPGARVLDAGAGTGWLVAELRRAGFDARGIDSSRRSVARAREAGVPVELEAIEAHEDGGLAAVVLWHSLEHLDDPAGALARVREWLAPRGLVLVAVPNVASWQARIAGPAWLHLDAPRHRSHLTPAGLAELLARTGFAPGRAHHMVWEHNPAGMWLALLARLGATPNLPFHLLKRTARPAARDAALLPLALPLAPAALALEGAAARARAGGTVALIAQRVE